MNLFEQLQIGETLELRMGEITSRTRVERIDSETTFVVSQPTHKLLPIIFEPNETVLLFFFRDNGMFSFRASYITRGTIDNMRVCGFEAVSEIEKNQRRFSYRLPIMMDLTLRKKNQLDQSGMLRHNAKTINLSQEGLLFTVDVQFSTGTQLLIEFHLLDMELYILTAEVLRCDPPADGDERYHVAARFINMIKKDQAQVAKFILQQQILARKRRHDIGAPKGSML